MEGRGEKKRDSKKELQRRKKKTSITKEGNQGVKKKKAHGTEKR